MSDILFKNCSILDGRYCYNPKLCVGVTNGKIDHIGGYRQGSVREYDCNGGILMPAFCNVHTHSAMTLLRGIGEDVPFSKWLKRRVIPAEVKLTADDCHTGTVLACAEMLKYGIASCTDIYSFGRSAVKAYHDVGFKANFAPNFTCVNDDGFEKLPVYSEYDELSAMIREYGDDNIKLDVALNAACATTEKAAVGAIGYASDNGYGIYIDLPDTKSETDDFITAHGMTPTAYFERLGVFDMPVTFAHSVAITDGDREIMCRNKAVIVSCPQSDLKLGIGICDYNALKNSGVICAVATDGDASNNNMNMLRELRLAALLAKGTTNDASAFLASEALWAGYRAGYISQRRLDSGYIQRGMNADLVLFSTDEVNMVPNGDLNSSLLYSSDGIAEMTMVGGKILYEKGNYTTIDIDKTKADAVMIRNRITGK